MFVTMIEQDPLVVNFFERTNQGNLNRPAKQSLKCVQQILYLLGEIIYFSVLAKTEKNILKFCYVFILFYI